MGLAKLNENGWIVRRDFLQVLKAMQQTGDRQKMLHQYGLLMSDPRLPTVVTRVQDIELLEGRVLAHVHDDLTGEPQVILEGTDGKVQFIRNTSVIGQLRAAENLGSNSFVSLTRVEEGLRIEDHGDAHAYLRSERIREHTNKLIQRGIVAIEMDYDGWLGAFHRALANPPAHQQERDRTAPRGRGKTRGR